VKGLKKTLVLLIGLAISLCVGPALAGSADYGEVNIPYAQHDGHWWSGLALSNMGPNLISLEISTTHTGKKLLVGEVDLQPFSQDVRLLPDFFTISPYPTENDGRVSLRIKAYGGDVDDNLGVTLFMGNPEGGFGFYNYGLHLSNVPQDSGILQDICDELNFARTQPVKYAQTVLEPRLERFDGNIYTNESGRRFLTHEGKAPVQEAIDELKAGTPIGPLTLDSGLSKASDFLASHQARTGTAGHFGPNGMDLRQRIEKFGTWTGSIGENCAYGIKTARDIVAELIIDDGVSNRGHRVAIYNADFHKVGIAYYEGENALHGSVCVMDFAQGFTEN
jgi:uncharacterized protein YkwD